MATVRGLLIAFWVASAAIGALSGCGGEDSGGEDAGGVAAASGIAKTAAVAYQDAPGLGDEEGALVIDVRQGGKPADETVTVKVRGVGKRAGTVEKGKAGQRFVVPSGSYTAEIEHGPTEATRATGKVSHLAVRARKQLDVKVDIEHPVGGLELHFTNDGINVDGRTRITAYKSGDDPEVSVPVLSGQTPGAVLVLPAGSYDVHAVYEDGPSVRGEAWIKGIAVAGDGSKATDSRDFGIKLNGVVVTATNYGQAVNERTSVYLYRPGADMTYAVAVARGKAGELIPVESGTYDLRVVYQPSDNTDTWADKRMPGLTVATTPENGKVSLTMEMEKPIATLKVKAIFGAKDVSEKAQVRLINAGADRGAASDVVNATADTKIVVPAGRYEMQVTFKDGPDHGASPWVLLELPQGGSVDQEVRLGG